MRDFIHNVMDYHVPDNHVDFDGASMHSKCKICNKRILQDSQGNWFSFPRDTTLERYFPYKPTLSEIKEAIPDLNGDINWITLDKREVEIKKTTLLGITNPKNI